MKTLFFLLIPLIVFSQNENIEKMKKLPKAEFEKAFNDSIVSLKSLDLWNFIKSSRESGIDLNNFNPNFVTRLENAEWPNEMHFLTKILIEQKTEKNYY
jgi:F420-0:gamma-glutamyl ligase-like protein